MTAPKMTEKQLFKLLNSELEKKHYDRHDAWLAKGQPAATPASIKSDWIEDLKFAQTWLENNGEPHLFADWANPRFLNFIRATKATVGAGGQTALPRVRGIEQAWREVLGKEEYASWVSRPMGSDRFVAIHEWMGAPGLFEFARRALADGAAVTSAQTLSTAIAYGQRDLFDALLSAGAPANGNTKAYLSSDLPLSWMVYPSLAEKAGLKLSEADARALTTQLREELLSHGADVNRLKGASSILVTTLASGDPTSAAWFVEKGAVVDKLALETLRVRVSHPAAQKKYQKNFLELLRVLLPDAPELNPIPEMPDVSVVAPRGPRRKR